MDLRAGHVIAGVDGSDQAGRALEFAASEAELRGMPLEVIYAVDYPMPLPTGGGLPPGISLAEARSQLAQIADNVRERHAGVPVAAAVLLGRASDVLVEHSAVGQLVVVGARGRSTAERILLGSVSVSVAAHAHCPVAVVPEETGDVQRIVVGTDGSETATVAVEVAFEEAKRRDRPLEVMSAIDPAVYGTAWFWTMIDPINDVQQAASQVVERETASLRRRHPGVVVRTEVVTGRPASALIERSTPGTLTVLGSRGRGGVRGALLGSVSQNVLHHAVGPTLVVHPPRARPVDRADYGQSLL